MQRTLFAILLALLCASPAQAYLVYTSEADFTAAHGIATPETEGFESEQDWPSAGVTPNTLSYGGYELTWTGMVNGASAPLVGNTTPSGVSHSGARGMYILGNSDWESVSGELDAGEFLGMGFWIRAHPGYPASGFSLFLDNQQGTQQVDLNGNDPGSDYAFPSLTQYYFLGVLAESGEKFNSFEIMSSTGTEQNIWVDDFTFLMDNPQPGREVPIPAAVWLLGSGLFGLGALRRAKR